MLATELESMALPLGIAAGVMLLGWLILLAAVSVANRPNRPEPVSAGLELGGQSPPAVAAMLTHRWKPNPIGASATLVDLAARDLIRFEPMAEGGFQVRVADQPPPPNLLDYEAHVLDLVQSRASNGVVPCAALQVRETTSMSPSTFMLGSKAVKVYSSKTTNWFKQFDRMVAADARRRGLSRVRFSRATTTFVVLTAAVPALLVGLAISATSDNSQTSTCNNCAQSSNDPLLGALAIGFFVWLGLMFVFRWLQDDRDTPAGLVEAGRWLGLRGNLRNDSVFGAQHVDAVAVWDRLLAFGMALGVAHVASEDVPIAAESKREAWSAASGSWRLVHIDYPKHLPPGYGMPIWISLVRGVIGVVISGFVLVVGVPFVLHVTTDVNGNPGVFSSAADTTVKVIAALMAVAAAIALLRALVMLGLAGIDVVATREVEGLVLRSYSYTSNNQDWWEAAVDDGTSDQVRAWRGTGQLPAGLQEGCRVRATITRRLSVLKSVDIVPGRPVSEPTADPHPTSERSTLPDLPGHA